MSEYTNLPEYPDVQDLNAAETPEAPDAQDLNAAEIPEAPQPQADAPEEPDILIQDLENIPESAAPVPDESGSRCMRCNQSVPDGEEFCDECTQTMQAYPIAPGAWIGAVLGVLFGLFGLFVLCVSTLIANPVVKGDKALEQGDLRSCYNHYEESYNIAQRLNDLLFPNSELSFFNNGSRTLEKQIIALRKLNGPYQAGKAIEQFYGEKPPKLLRGTYDEYQNIAAFVEEMQSQYYAYKNTLKAGETGDCDKMLELVEETAEKLPKTPEYLVQYYRFSVCFSASDDPARTCKLLDELIEMEPDALWMYASEGIRAYNRNEEYEKALAICNSLMQRDASDPATVAYTMAELRMLERYADAIEIYDRALKLTEASSEMQRQRAIIWMLQGDYAQAQDMLVESYSPQTATLEHLATIALCAYANGDMDVYKEYKTLLDSYTPFEQVDLFVAGECTLEEIFLSGGGEVQ